MIARVFRMRSHYRSSIYLMLAAVPWHWWLGAGLLIAGIGAVVSLGAGYLRKVESLKHPNRAQRKAQQNAK